MKKVMSITVLFVLNLVSIYSQDDMKTMSVGKTDSTRGNPLIGSWVRIGPGGPVSLTFTETGLANGDFGMDRIVDVVDEYTMQNDTIGFTDKEGQMCEGTGSYKIYHTDYYLSFDLIEDLCAGRIQILMGFWTRPDYKELLARLEKEIKITGEPELFLNRARIYMAVGEPEKARADFDVYLKIDPTNARVYLNRAGTKFPDNLEGVVKDCSTAIDLDPDNKNAWFMRGLARYALGEEEHACEDFSRAIELGFSVLRIAEQQRCAEYWEKDE